MRVEWSNKADGFDCEVKYFGDDQIEPWLYIKFQAEPIKKVGINGMCMLDILDTMIKRLNDFETQWPCEENISAINGMNAAKLALTAKRDRRRLEAVETSI